MKKHLKSAGPVDLNFKDLFFWWKQKEKIVLKKT